MQYEKSEVNHAIARAIGEPHDPAPADYIGDETHGARFIAWATPQFDAQALPDELEWIYNNMKLQQGNVVALHWAMKMMGLARR